MNTATCDIAPAHEQRIQTTSYSNALGYLRAFVVVLVVLHHALLAYNPFAPGPAGSLAAPPQWWKAFPVVDAARFGPYALINAVNDTFFMALMFLLSGLFVWSSLKRKGAATYVKQRFVRLGVPFILAASIVSPLAYFPAYLQRTAEPSFAGWWQEWVAQGPWPVGPVWFIALLLAFDCVAAFAHSAFPRWAEAAGRLSACFDQRPLTFFSMFVSVSIAVYLPMTAMFHPLAWTTIGPITFQTTRILLYGFYFVTGVAMGAYGIDRGLLARTGGIARRCWTWWTLALLSVLALLLSSMTPDHPDMRFLPAFRNLSFATTCAAFSLAFLALFLRFANRSNRVWNSLRDHSYGIYLIHYAFCSWLQYALLPVGIPAIGKGMAVFAGTLLLSWWVSSWRRRCI